VFDARTGLLVRTAALDLNPVALAIARTAARVFAVSAGNGVRGTVRVFDARTGAALSVLSVAADPASVTVDDAGGRVFVVSGAQGLAYAVSTIEARSGRVLRAIVVGPRPSGDVTADAALAGLVAVDTRRGHMFVAAGLPGGASGVVMLDARTGALMRAVPLGITPHGIAMDERRGRVFVEGDAGVQRARVDTLDARSGALIRSVDIGVAAVGGQSTLAVDGARGRIFVGAIDQIAMLDATSGAMLRTLPTRDTPIEVGSLVVDGPTGHLFAYGTSGNTAAESVFDVVTGRALAQATFPRGAATQVSALDVRRARAIILVVGSLAYETTPASPGEAFILDTRDGAVLQNVIVGLYPVKAVVDPASRVAFVIDQNDDTVTWLAPPAAVTPSPTPPPPPATPTHAPYIVRAIPLTARLVAVDEHVGHAFVAGEQLVTGVGLRPFVDMLDARSGAVLRTTHPAGSPDALAVSSPMARAFVALSPYAQHAYPGVTIISGIATPTDLAVVTATVPGYPVALGVSERAGRVFALTAARADTTHPHASGFVSTLDARSGRVLRTVRVPPADFSSLAVAEGAQRVFASSWTAGTTAMLEAQSGRLLGTIRTGLSSSGITVDEAQGHVFVNTGSLVTLDAHTGHIISRTNVPMSLVGGVAVAERAGRVFATLVGPDSSGSAVGVFDPSNGALLRTVGPSPGTVNATPYASIGPPTVDERRGRVYTLVRSPQADSQSPPTDSGELAVLNAKTGAILQQGIALGDIVTGNANDASVVPPRIAVDEHTNRVFVLTDTHVVMLDTTRLEPCAQEDELIDHLFGGLPAHELEHAA